MGSQRGLRSINSEFARLLYGGYGEPLFHRHARLRDQCLLAHPYPPFMGLWIGNESESRSGWTG